MSASSPCGSYHRRLHRSQVTSIDNSFGRKSEESAEEVSCLMISCEFYTVQVLVQGVERPL